MNHEEITFKCMCIFIDSRYVAGREITKYVNPFIGTGAIDGDFRVIITLGRPRRSV